ncbi:uncharacterized protein LOC143890473 [Tasmannia lanceolata]|uniref:uncharacterized protein LOC143890473 n=1 Tax=Tasmannia lanceolata TaxID=3420 RepID=UPI004064B1D5
MPRNSRRKSYHKQHKNNTKDVKDYTDSDEEHSLKDKKVREERVVSSGIRVSMEKKKSPSDPQQGKDLFDPCNGDLSGEYGSSKKGKDRADSSVNNRWNGGSDGLIEGGKEPKGEVLGSDSERGPRPNDSTSVETKSWSSRRNESLSERKDEDLEPKKGSVKDLSRKATHQNKDAKDKEREIGRDKKVPEAVRERSVDAVTVATGVRESNMKKETQMGDLEEEHVAKREVEITDCKIQDDLRNHELEKELDKRIKRRRDDSGDKEKWKEDVRDGDNRRLSSTDDDRLKNGRYKDGRQIDGRYKDERQVDGRYKDERQVDGRYKDERRKYRKDLDRDHRYEDDKHRDEKPSRDRASTRSENKNFRDESKTSESRHKKTKVQDSDHDGSPYADEKGARLKDNRGKKRSCDDNDSHSDIRSRSTKEQRSDVEKNAVSNSKVDSASDKGRSESHYHHSDAVDSTPSSSRLKRSSSCSAHAVKDHYRHGSKRAETPYNDISEERLRPNTSTRELTSAFGIPERVSESRSMEKPKQKDDTHVGELSAETVPASQYERSPKSRLMVSPIHLIEKSPSSTSGDKRYSNRAGVRRSFDGEEMGRQSGGCKDARGYNSSDSRGQDFPFEKTVIDDSSQTLPFNGESTPIISNFNRTGLFSSSSPSLLPPPPPLRLGVDSPSVLGSSEEDSRAQVGDRKYNNRYKGNGDSIMGRGQGNAWKGIPNWPPPVANGFIPFQHGPPPSGFHSVMQQFPSPFFGVRPSMELNHSGVYHMHDADRFSDHGRPFQLHGWDGSSGVFGDESHVFGRPDWDQNRHLMSSRGWEMNDLCKGQNRTMNMDFPAPQKHDYLTRAAADETWAGQSSHRPQLELLPAESIENKIFDAITPTEKITSEAPLKIVHEKTPEPSKLPTHDNTARFCQFYLSKLDISVDLAHPELYKQCTSLLEMDGDTTGDCHATKSIHIKEIEVDRKSSNDRLAASLFPATTEAVFQRAMALYKKQKEEKKAKTPFPSFRRSEVENASQASDTEKLGHVEDSRNPAIQGTCSPSNEEIESSSGDSKDNLSADAKEQQADNITGDVVCANGSSQACVAFMPESIECRLNSSRIHNSPESTH